MLTLQRFGLAIFPAGRAFDGGGGSAQMQATLFMTSAKIAAVVWGKISGSPELDLVTAC